MQRVVGIDEKLPLGQAIPLGVQHVFAMFGSTVLVPFLTGLSPAIALLSSGIGTIVFLLITKSKVPAYLGSSFAYIAALTLFVKTQHNLGGAMSGVVSVGLVYLLLFLLVKLIGTGFIHKLVPPVVSGPVVAIIGLSLTPTAASMAAKNWYIAAFTLVVTAVLSIYAKGFFKVIPILLGIIAGYILAACTGLVNFAPIAASFATPLVFPLKAGVWSLPVINISAILAMAPLALVTIIEDLGHIFVLSNITDTDMIENPGFDRVVLGNGLSTLIAGFIGGPPVTTYGENIGVLAVTRVYSSRNIWYAAFFAIILSFVNPLQALIMSIPTPVMGGVTILLFGMIGATGLRTLVEAKVDFADGKNLIVASIIFALGIGLPDHSVAWATAAGIILHYVLDHAGAPDAAPDQLDDAAK
ncbi:MAG: NCS2 family nucleobase:cation symporter [Peptococcaceae bacterium]|nr:NCS2 family nucleobase:cation symporter [Peptococcaceae bacterium]